jgi:hypothetical protein
LDQSTKEGNQPTDHHTHLLVKLVNKCVSSPLTCSGARIQPTIKDNIRAALAQQGLPVDIRKICESAAWCANDAHPKNLWTISDLAGKEEVDGVKLGTVLLRNVRWKGGS